MKILRVIYFLLSFFLFIEAGFLITEDNDTIVKCNYIKHVIEFSADSSDQFILTQQGNTFEFEKGRSFGSGPVTFTLNVPDLKIKPGIATLTQITGDSKTYSIDISFTDYFFEPEIDAVKQYDTIKIIQLRCSQAFDYIKFYRETKDGDNLEELPKTSDQTGYSLSTAPPGVYYIKADNPYRDDEHVIVKTFTHIVDHTAIHKALLNFEFPMPTSRDGSTPITITYPSSLTEIKNIRVRKNNDFIYLNLKQDSSEKHHFTIDEVDNNYIVKVYINYENIDDVYQISMIIFSNYHAVIFNDNEIQVGYSFSISQQYYLQNSELEVTLQFESEHMAKTHINSILYKQLDGTSSSTVKSQCSQEKQTLKCKVSSSGTSLIGIGIGQCLVSSQVITVFSYEVPSTEIIENKCLVESSLESLNDLSVKLDFPKKGLPKQLGTYLVKDYLYNADQCGSQLDENESIYNINCGLSGLSAGHYYFTIIFDDNKNSSITIQDINFEIKNYYSIIAVNPQSFYRISSNQELVISFDKEVKEGEITKIKLVRNSVASQEYPVIQDSDNSVKKFYLFNLDQQKLAFGTYYIHFNSPCKGSSSFISSPFYVSLNKNEILSVKPDYLVMSDPTSNVTITFKHQAGFMLEELLFTNNSTLKNTPINITNKNYDYITVPSSTNLQQGYYSIQMNYTDGSYKTNETLKVFYDKIQLQQEISYVNKSQNLTYIQIPLAHPILYAQIIKITSKSEGSSEEKECEFSLVEDTHINVTLQTTFDRYGNYYFYIYDVLTKEPLVYTIKCGPGVNLAVAQIDISISNPAKNEPNHIDFTFQNYKVSDIHTIVFTKVNRIYEEEETPIKFCKNEVQGCHGVIEVRTPSISNTEVIRTTINYEKEELYLYKYVLTSISDNMLTRYFEKGQYELLDFSLTHNIFGFLDGQSISSVETVFELYSESAAEQLSEQISCKIHTDYTINEEKCEESNGVCELLCTRECVKSETKMVCSFNFGPISREATVLYKFADFDYNYKYLHIMRVIPPEETCKLADFDDNLNMKLCSYHKPNHLTLYFNEEITSNCECDCYGHDIHWDDNDNCADVSIPHEYVLVKPMKIQAIRNKNEINSFLIETDSITLNLLKEIMQDYQGKLIAQMEGGQKVKYIFPSGSNASKIEKIILTHRTNDIVFISDETTCKVGDTNAEFECYYDLQDKIDAKYLNMYDISYYHSECSEEFRLASPIKIEEPPVILSHLSPRYSWLGKPEEFDLTYMFYFYEGSCNIPTSITLVNNVNGKTKTVDLFNKTSGTGDSQDIYSRKHLYFNSQRNFVEMGYYYIIEHFKEGCLEDKVHKNKTILFYLNEIEITPTNVTYYTDEPKPESTATSFVYSPIIIEQISSVTLGGKNVQYTFSSENITFIFTDGLIDFTKGGEHKIVIETITGKKQTFTVIVEYKPTLPESEILIEGPVPGYENTTNIIHFFSPMYNLTKLTHIVFITLDENGKENEYVVHKNTIIENYCNDTNSINLPLYLPHNTSYTYKGVYNSLMNEKNENGNYTLKGFFIEQHFYFMDKTASVVYYHINFYTNEMARNTISRIRENNVIKRHCNITSYNAHIVECLYSFNNKYPITLNISIDENATYDKTLPVHVMSAELAQTCYANKFIEQGITLNIKSASSVGTVKGYFDVQIINSENSKQNDYYLSKINFKFPILYKPTVLNMAVDFQRNGTIYHLEVPDSDIRFINYAEVSEIPTQYLNPFEDREKLLKIKLTHDVLDTDLSHIELENINNPNEIITIEQCSITSDVDEDDVYTCNVSEINEYKTFIVHVYNSCKQVLNPVGKFYVHFTEDFNFLQQLSPKAVRYSELSTTKFKLAYNISLKSLPEKIELINYSNNKPSNYKVSYFQTNQNGRSIYVQATLSGSKETGLFRVKSTFNSASHVLNVDYSPLTILIYENEIALSKSSETLPYGTTMKSINIRLVNPIIADQIYQITYQRHNHNLYDAIVADWKLTTSKDITVYFQGELRLEDNYVITIISAKDETNDATFTLNVSISYNFEFSREFIDMGDDDYFTMTITPLNDYEQNIVNIESNDDEAVITKNEQTKNYYDDKGNYLSTEKRSWYTVNYTKRGSLTLPKEVKFKYYFKDVSESYDIETSIHITDSGHSFFDYGLYTGKTYYRDSSFEIILTSIKTINCAGLNAYLRNDVIEKELLHDTNEPTRFYLNSLVGMSTGDMELIVYEKGDREAIVDQGQMFHFSANSSPVIGNSGCFNNGKLVGNYCKCPNGFYGKVCSYTEDNVDDVAKDFIHNLEQEMGVDISVQVVVQDLLDLVAIVKEKHFTIPNINYQIPEFEKAQPSTESEAEGFCAWASLIIEGDNNDKTRRLHEKQRDIVLKHIKQVAKEWKLSDDKPFSTFVLPLQNIYYHKIKATSNAFEQYKQSYIESKPSSFIEIPNIDDPQGYYLLSANEQHGEYNINKQQSKVSMKLQYYPSDAYRRMLSENGNNEMLLHFSVQDFAMSDNEIVDYYSKRGINMYNSEDPFFTDTCYSVDPDYFEYDLTHKYRMQLYQNMSFVLNNDYNCKYAGMSVIPEYMTYTCSLPTLSDTISVDLELKDKPLSKENSKGESSIPLKCIGQITEIHNNIAFWLFFLLILLMINAILFVLFIKHVLNKDKDDHPQEIASHGTSQPKQNCSIVTDGDNQSAQVNNVFKKISNTTSNNDKSPRGERDQLPSTADLKVQSGCQPTYSRDDELLLSTFVEWLLHNFKRYHPITANYFCKERYMQIPIFVFSIATVFAFDAILFKDSYIDARVNNKSRNSFGYPLAHEAGAVFGAIFIAWILSAIPKTIYYFLMKDNLSNLLRTILSISFIVVCATFMFFWWIYSMGFCGVYKNTQFGWFYACIWSLFFDWILFAPVFIVVMSVLNYTMPGYTKDILWIIKEIARF